MKLSIVCLVLLSVYGARGQRFDAEWTANLLQNINLLNSNIQSNVMSMTQQLQQDISENVNEMSANIQRATSQAQTQGINIAANTGTFSISATPGNTKSVVSGYDADGQRYYRESEEKIIGNILHHTDRIRNPSLGTTNEFRYTIDLSDPTARPIIQN